MAATSISGAARVNILIAQVEAEILQQQQESQREYQKQFELQAGELRAMRRSVEIIEKSYKEEIAKYQDKIRNQEQMIHRLEIELSSRQIDLPTSSKTFFDAAASTTRKTTSREVTAHWSADVDLDLVLPQHKKTGTDWYAVFNPHISRNLDVSLCHTLQHDMVVCCVRFSRDGKYLATASYQSTQIFDVVTGARVATLAEDDNSTQQVFIRSICFSPDGHYLATASEDKIIRLWAIYEKKIIKRIVGHTDEVYSIEFAANGERLVSGARDGTVRVWDIISDTTTLVLAARDGVSSVSVSPDMKYVAASCNDARIHMWSMFDGKLMELLNGPDGHTDLAYCVSFLSSSTELASGSFDRTVKLWKLHAPDREMRPSTAPTYSARTLKGHKDFVTAIGTMPGSRWVLSGSKDRTARVWDAHSGELQLVLHGHSNTVLSIATSQDYFATGGGDKLVRIWSYATSSAVP